MKVLSQLISKLKKFIKLSNSNKLLIIKVVFITAIVRFAMVNIKFKILKKYMGEHNKESTWTLKTEEYVKIKKIRWAVITVSKNTPWESKCLVQALAAQRLLTVQGISSTLYLGVNKQTDISLNAHAWIRSGDVYVTGGTGEGFATVAKFTR